MITAIGTVLLFMFYIVRSLLVTNDIIIPDPRLVSTSGAQDLKPITSGISLYEDTLEGAAKGLRVALQAAGVQSPSIVGVPIEKYYGGNDAGLNYGNMSATNQMHANDASQAGSDIIDFYYGLRNYMPIVEPIGNWMRAIAAWIGKFFYLLDKFLQAFYVRLFSIMDLKTFQPDTSETQGVSLADWLHFGQEFGTIICILCLIAYCISTMLAVNTSGYQRAKDIFYNAMVVSFFIAALPTLTGFAASGAQHVAQGALGSGYGSLSSQPSSLADTIVTTNVYDVSNMLIYSRPGQQIPVSGGNNGNDAGNAIMYQPKSYLYYPKEHYSLFKRYDHGNGNEMNSGQSGSDGKLGQFSADFSGNFAGTQSAVAGGLPNNPITSQQIIINLPAMTPEDRNVWNGLQDTSIVNFFDNYGTDADDLDSDQLDEMQKTISGQSNSSSGNNNNNNNSNSKNSKSNNNKSSKSSKSKSNNSNYCHTKGCKKYANSSKGRSATKSFKSQVYVKGTPDHAPKKSLSSLTTILPNVLKSIKPSSMIDTINPVANFASVNINPMHQNTAKAGPSKKVLKETGQSTDVHSHGPGLENSSARLLGHLGNAYDDVDNGIRHKLGMHSRRYDMDKHAKETYGTANPAKDAEKEAKSDKAHGVTCHGRGNCMSQSLQQQQQPPSMTDLLKVHIAGEGRTSSLQPLGAFSAVHKTLPALADCYGRYKVNWLDIYLGLIILFIVFVAFIMKLVSAFFKAMVMYATSGIILGKSITSPSKIKYWIRSYFGLFEMLMLDVVMIRLYFVGYMTIIDATTSIMFDDFPVSSNTVALGIVQAICEIGLLYATLNGVSAIDRLLGQPTGAQDGWAKAAIGLQMGAGLARGGFHLGMMGAHAGFLGAKGIGKGIGHLSGATASGLKNHKGLKHLVNHFKNRHKNGTNKKAHGGLNPQDKAHPRKPSKPGKPNKPNKKSGGSKKDKKSPKNSKKGKDHKGSKNGKKGKGHKGPKNNKNGKGRKGPKNNKNGKGHKGPKNNKNGKGHKGPKNGKDNKGPKGSGHNSHDLGTPSGGSGSSDDPDQNGESNNSPSDKQDQWDANHDGVNHGGLGGSHPSSSYGFGNSPASNTDDSDVTAHNNGDGTITFAPSNGGSDDDHDGGNDATNTGSDDNGGGGNDNTNTGPNSNSGGNNNSHHKGKGHNNHHKGNGKKNKKNRKLPNGSKNASKSKQHQNHKQNQKQQQHHQHQTKQRVAKALHKAAHNHPVSRAVHAGAHGLYDFGAAGQAVTGALGGGSVTSGQGFKQGDPLENGANDDNDDNDSGNNDNNPQAPESPDNSQNDDSSDNDDSGDDDNPSSEPSDNGDSDSNDGGNDSQNMPAENSGPEPDLNQINSTPPEDSDVIGSGQTYDGTYFPTQQEAMDSFRTPQNAMQYYQNGAKDLNSNRPSNPIASMPADLGQIRTKIPSNPNWIGSGQIHHGTYFPTQPEAMNSFRTSKQALNYFEHGAKPNPTFDPHAFSGQNKRREEAEGEWNKEATQYLRNTKTPNRQEFKAKFNQHFHDKHPDFRH